MKINKNPPAKAIFFKNDPSCIWSEKSLWNITAVAIQNKLNKPADIFALYPSIINIGAIISSIIAGIIKIPEF